MHAFKEIMSILGADVSDPLSDFVLDILSYLPDERWEVDGSGLWFVPLDYMIDANRLLKKRGELYDWPLHLAEKEWVNFYGFLPQFIRACFVCREATRPEVLDLDLLRRTVDEAEGIRQNLGLP